MNATRVFISHTRLDGEWTTSFAKSLAGHGVAPWLDFLSISSGKNSAEQLESALRDSEAVVAVFSSDETANSNVLFEVGAALGMKKPFIVIAPDVQASSRLPASLHGMVYIRRGTPAETASVVARTLEQQLTSVDK